jgi:protease-4
VVVEDLCASGGYYVAAAATRSTCAKGSIVGSIGVRMDQFRVVRSDGKLGVERALITAGKNKALLDPFLPEDPAHKQIAVDLITEIHNQFIAAVREGRGKRLKETQDMFSGLIWTGAKQRGAGLADAVGGLDYVAREVIKAEDIVGLHAEGKHRREVRAPLRRRRMSSLPRIFPRKACTILLIALSSRKHRRALANRLA